jgi:hypothetical protein
MGQGRSIFDHQDAFAAHQFRIVERNPAGHLADSRLGIVNADILPDGLDVVLLRGVDLVDDQYVSPA